MALTSQQEDFCKNIALYEMEPLDALKLAYGKTVKGKNKSELYSAVAALLRSKPISDEIDKLRKKYLDIDEVRKDIILEHNKTRELDITTIMSPVSYVDDNGVEHTRVDIKPVSEWSPELRRACTGFDRFGVPQFRNKDSATKELSRIFGLYKDNQILVQQDLDSIIDDAMGVDSKENKDEEQLLDAFSGETENMEMEKLDADIIGVDKEIFEEKQPLEVNGIDIPVEENNINIKEIKDPQERLKYLLK